MAELCEVRIVPDGPISGESLTKIAAGKNGGRHVSRNIRNLEGFEPNYGLNEGAIPDDGRFRYHVTVCLSSSRSAPFNRRLRFAFRQGVNVVATNIPLMEYPNDNGCIIPQYSMMYDQLDTGATTELRLISLTEDTPWTTGETVTITIMNQLNNFIRTITLNLITFFEDNAKVWDHQVLPNRYFLIEN